MNRQVILYSSIIISSFASGWILHGWKSDSEALVIERAAKAAQEATAEQIAKIEIKNTVIHQKVVERTYHEPVYQDCKHSPEAFEQIKELFKP
jgi:hypothetical protein